MFTTLTACALGHPCDTTDQPSVTTPLLKFMAEFVYNKSQRLAFDSSSPNGILLFREVSVREWEWCYARLAYERSSPTGRQQPFWRIASPGGEGLVWEIGALRGLREGVSEFVSSIACTRTLTPALSMQPRPPRT